MPIITLTTDLGDKDFYVAAVKAAILAESPEVNIVDVTHKLQLMNIIQASFIVRNLYKDFPAGTVHIIGIPPSKKYENSHLVVKINEQYFISGNNGLFSLLFDPKSNDYYELMIDENEKMNTFPTKNIYAKAACHLAKGGDISDLGNRIAEIEEKTMLIPVSVDNVIKGVVLYLDHYGNIITNISKDLFYEVGQGRAYEIHFRGDTISAISANYDSVVNGEQLALFNSSGFLEIAMNNGNASKILGLKESDVIRIEFYD